MREPRRFPAVLTGVMMGLLGKQWIPSSSLKFAVPPFTFQMLFGGAGMLDYLTFGDKVQTVVLVNLDGESKMVQAVRIPLPAHVLPSLIHPSLTQVQFLYSLAILLSVPLQLFPAVRIMENGLFISSGKADARVKWLKNVFRFSVVMLCTGISWAGAADLDKFVAFIGSFAWCVPVHGGTAL
jgi:proton-coupled amino acid transporter